VGRVLVVISSVDVWTGHYQALIAEAGATPAEGAEAVGPEIVDSILQ